MNSILMEECVGITVDCHKDLAVQPIAKMHNIDSAKCRKKTFNHFITPLVVT